MSRPRVGADARRLDSGRAEREQAEKERINRGRLFVQLMLKGAEAAGIDDLSKIQFNFCLQSDATQIPATRIEIFECLKAYLTNEAAVMEIEEGDFKKIEENFKSIFDSLHQDPTKLPDYQDTLNLRGKSFYDAALLIVDKLDKSDDAKEEISSNLMRLFLTFEYDLNSKQTPEEKQVYYEAYMRVLQSILQDALGDDKDAKNELKEAETILNIKERKAQITFSGTVTTTGAAGNLSGNNISLQIDEPRNRFCDFSKKQRDAWIAVYNINDREKKGIPSAEKYPEWFSKLSDIEKKIWLDKMAVVMTQPDPHKSEISMGAVVKKQGLPGLRNMLLSTFASINVNSDGKAEKPQVSPKTVRSSNLLALNKDGSEKITENQNDLSKDNILQVREIYANNKMDKSAKPFPYKKGREPYLLCQTLLRYATGGDDHVVKHKNAAIKELNDEAESQNKEGRIFGSNHSIGISPKVGALGARAMHSLVNTKDMIHISKVLEEFRRAAVLPAIRDEHATQKIVQHFKDAEAGQYKGISNLYNPEAGIKDITAEQANVLDRVLQATSMYTNINGRNSVYKKGKQLHLAALEEIIYQDTGNIVHSSCKSGKDREGVEKNYRNAMLAFYKIHVRLPPSSDKQDGDHPGDRAEFIKIFIELFKTNHQARLAELNAKGCEGQKALGNILPPDILNELKKDQPDLLNQHKKNSALNDIGKSAFLTLKGKLHIIQVKKDKAKVKEEVKNSFSDFMPKNDILSPRTSPNLMKSSQ